ncbi:MAG: hypothetical protein AAFN68_09110, partial [Pseudomonadota bacterium]
QLVVEGNCQQRIFRNPLVSADAGGGYGVGLYISELICQQTGWQIQRYPSQAAEYVCCIRFST